MTHSSSWTENPLRVVVVSQRVDHCPDRGETRDALDQALVSWLMAAGYCPYPIPNALTTESGLRRWLDHLNPQGILLSGGNDLGSVEGRDLTEHTLLKYAEYHRLPLLGICRGMQMLAAQAHTPLREVAGHIKCRHQIRGEINAVVNSYHQQSIENCPAGYRILAQSEDGCVEAIRHQELPWEGWMWHPEREPIFEPHDLNRLKELFG